MAADSYKLLDELRVAVGKRAVLFGDSVKTKHQSDWTGIAPAQPIAVVFPSSVLEVSTVLRICNAYKQGVVPQGGLTGLAGGATPTSSDICLSLDRMSGIEEIDEAACTMTVLAGTTLQSIQEAASELDLDFPLDMSSRATCQIGGVLATNAGGVRVLQSGTAREQVVGIEVVLADGTVLTSLNKIIKNNTGYDLKHLFIGSEGTLGIITRAVLKLRPRPLNRQTGLCALSGYEVALSFLRYLRRVWGPNLAAFELMWADFFEFGLSTSKKKQSPFGKEYALYALVERTVFDRDDDLKPDLAGSLLRALDEKLISDAVISHSASETESLWDIRECTAKFPTLLEPINFDISIPIGALGGFAEECKSFLTTLWPMHRSLFFGHVGDSNLHVTVDRKSIPGVSLEVVERAVYSMVERYRGSVSAEHGIGILKREYLKCSRSSAELMTMRLIKSAMDPRGIMNPGKLFPT